MEQIPSPQVEEPLAGSFTEGARGVASGDAGGLGMQARCDEIAHLVLQVRALFPADAPGVDARGMVNALTDAGVRDFARAMARLMRSCEQLQVLSAGAVRARSGRQAGQSGVAQSEGFRSDVEMMQQLTGVSRSEAARQVRVGESLLAGEAAERADRAEREALTARLARETGVGGDSGGGDAGSDAAAGAAKAAAEAELVLRVPWHRVLDRAIAHDRVTGPQYDAIKQGLGGPPTIADLTTGAAGAGGATAAAGATSAGTLTSAVDATGGVAPACAHHTAVYAALQASTFAPDPATAPTSETAQSFAAVQTSAAAHSPEVARTLEAMRTLGATLALGVTRATGHTSGERSAGAHVAGEHAAGEHSVGEHTTSAACGGRCVAALLALWWQAGHDLINIAGYTSVEELRKQARAVRDLIDPEGAEVRRNERYEARAFTYWTDPNGQFRARLTCDDDAAAWISTIFASALRPRRGGPRFIDPEEQQAGEALAKDTRTHAQISHDLLVDLLRSGSVADHKVVFGARQAGVRVVQVVNRDEYLAEQAAARAAEAATKAAVKAAKAAKNGKAAKAGKTTGQTGQAGQVDHTTPGTQNPQSGTSDPGITLTDPTSPTDPAGPTSLADPTASEAQADPVGVVAWYEDGLTVTSDAVVARQRCDAGVVYVTVDEQHNPLDVGREQRLYTPQQRIALATRDGGCRWTGCDRPASYCEAHHIDHWYSDQGRTDIDRGILLCRAHHMQLHNKGWKITRDGRGPFMLHPPPGVDGTAPPITLYQPPEHTSRPPGQAANQNTGTGTGTGTVADAPSGLRQRESTSTAGETGDAVGGLVNDLTGSPTGASTRAPTGASTRAPTGAPAGGPTNSPAGGPAGSPAGGPANSPASGVSALAPPLPIRYGLQTAALPARRFKPADHLAYATANGYT